MSFKIRFNLGRGKNYLKWKITDNTNNESFYLDPNKVLLTLVECKLRNQKGTAKKIYEGQHKTVCAWIDCKDILVGGQQKVKGIEVRYNPKENPYWTLDGKNVDGYEFDKLLTYENKIICENK